MSDSSSTNQRPLALLHLSATSPPPSLTSQADSSPRMEPSSFLDISPSPPAIADNIAAAAAASAASATLSPMNTTKKRLRSMDGSGADDASMQPHDPMQRALTPSSSSDSPLARASPLPFCSSAFAGRGAASTNSLSSLAGASSTKDNSDLQRLLDESDDEEDGDEAEEGEEDGDEESEEKSPATSPHGVLTPLSSMAAAAAASQTNPSPSPSPLAPAAQPRGTPTPLPLNSTSSGSGGTEFLSQLFVIYMPKNNFKRFVVSSLNTMIIRASKIEKAMPRANHPPMSSRPAPSGSSPTSRPPIPPLSTHSAASSSSTSASAMAASAAAVGGSPSSPSAAKKPLPSANFSSLASSEQHNDYTYNVSMEDVIACLEAHGVTYNPAFMWMDLSDFGQRFVQQMMDNSKASADGTPSPAADAQPANDTYGGLWYNVAHKVTAQRIIQPTSLTITTVRSITAKSGAADLRTVAELC